MWASRACSAHPRRGTGAGFPSRSGCDRVADSARGTGRPIRWPARTNSAAQAIEEPRIFKPGQVVRGQMEVAILVVVAVEKSGEIEGAGHGEKSAEEVGMAQGDVHRVVAAEAAAERKQARVAIFLADEGQDFAGEDRPRSPCGGRCGGAEQSGGCTSSHDPRNPRKRAGARRRRSCRRERRPCRSLQTGKSGRRRWEKPGQASRRGQRRAAPWSGRGGWTRLRDIPGSCVAPHGFDWTWLPGRNQRLTGHDKRAWGVEGGGDGI